IVGEWMPLTVFSNQDGRFVNTTQDLGLADTEGWWWSLTQADLDSDGDMDLLCGNLGSNSKFQGTKEHPIHLYWNDFDGNGSGDIVLAKEDHGELVPVRGRECSSQQCPMILDRFPTYDAFAHAALNDIYGVEGLAQALHLKATFMKSCVLWNEGDGELTLQELPVLAQIAPVNGFAVADWNEDGHPDVFLAGNHWGAEVETVRYDAGLGLLLLGDGKHGFQVIDAPWSGIRARGNVKDVAALPLADGRGTAVVIANNNGPLQLFVPSSTSWKAAR
ncbi:MAG: VCBS repeat-containing protein, partial [Flavobacteriales bacterium]|nr:VCBS repeat-containing protein [Flavobacteriales bacterium]